MTLIRVEKKPRDLTSLNPWCWDCPPGAQDQILVFAKCMLHWLSYLSEVPWGNVKVNASKCFTGQVSKKWDPHITRDHPYESHLSLEYWLTHRKREVYRAVFWREEMRAYRYPCQINTWLLVHWTQIRFSTYSKILSLLNNCLKGFLKCSGQISKAHKDICQGQKQHTLMCALT